ncbi:hypothetical protein BDW67DRAFT_179068 [Aspergillus spinulosporus]
MGAEQGIDEGIHQLPVISEVEQAKIKGNVSAMVQIGSVGGPFCLLICDPSAAPASIRGLCTCVFGGFVYVGIVLAYFANHGCEVNLDDQTHNRWLVPTSLHIMFAGQIEQALNNLARLCHLPPEHEYLVHEITSIRRAHEIEMEATMGTGPIGVIKETLLIPSSLYRIYLFFMCQILSQWTGAGSITVYATDLFHLLGITGNNTNLLVTAVFGIVKFIAAIICALFLVDIIGRRRSLLGISLQAISKVYISGGNRMIYISGFGWALGWNSIQYLLTEELFPLRIGALATSMAMTLHFVNQYGNSRAVPNMGTFWCFGTAGRSLASMDRPFALPWYKIGWYGTRDAEEYDCGAGRPECP